MQICFLLYFNDIPRAKKTRYTPTVLSRKEIDAIIENLEYPSNLVVKLLYGGESCCLKSTNLPKGHAAYLQTQLRNPLTKIRL